MNSKDIMKKLIIYENLNRFYKKYNALLDTNEDFNILEKISSKSQEAQKLGIALYYFENSNKNESNLVFETLNETWWRDHIDFIMDLYYYLTGSEINIILKEVKGIVYNYENKKAEFDYVSLFSGGLDSLIGAFYLIQKNQKFILSHTKTSKSMFGKAKVLLKTTTNAKNYPLININTQFKANSINPKSPQTRTLLFILNSVPICDYYGINKIAIFENIALMVNPPVSTYAIPTKTTRPEIISAIDNFLKKFLDFKLEIELPFRFYTKAEMIAAFKDKREIMKNSFSCFNYRGKKKMCGKCYGCFIRMVSLAANSIIERDNYLSNFLEYKHYPKKESDYVRFLIIEDLLKFCKKMVLEEKIEEYINDSTNSADIFDDIDIWDALIRFSKDVFLGIKNYYNLNDLKIKEFLIGRKFAKYNDLLDPNLLEERENELKKFEIK